MRMKMFILLAAVITGAAHAESADRVRLGMQVGYGIEQADLFGSGRSSNTRLLMFQPQVSVALKRTAGQPVVELVNELTFADSLRPCQKLIMSANDGFRFHIHPTSRMGEYLELGAGIGSSALHADPAEQRSRSDLPFRQLNGWLQYHLQVGAGIRVNIGGSRVHIGYRLTHFSNNETTRPNLGLNLNTMVVNWQSPAF